MVTATAHTKYPHTISWPSMSHVNGKETNVLKPASNNKKLGNGVWQKGPFKGMPLYSLTLEERATCETSCPVWDKCYGSSMPFASRFDVSLDAGKSLMGVLGNELDILDNKHPRYSVRLHILGDFFSHRYVAFWQHALRTHPGLHIYGYTHRTGAIGVAIDRVFIKFPGRFNILQSDPIQETVRPVALMEFTPGADLLIKCPEQTGKTESCLTCGLCTSPAFRGVTFIEH